MIHSILPGVQKGCHRGWQQGRQEVGRPQVRGRHLVQLVQDKQVLLGQGRPQEVPVQGRGQEVLVQGRPQDRLLLGSLLPQQAGFPMNQANLGGLVFQTQLRHH
ncbi:hypothetical protein JEQ12_018308 [Ovis aries]|uniref:Uncharacterized protein n=1 Tax=Ovis aries TaxID=9940 RepID=A0A836A305_SHEEP|nr:hypothetical protein JEQ12_018308 [Ovis aries]